MMMDPTAQRSGRTVAIALLLGVLADLLLHGQPAGLNVTLCLVATAAAVALTRRNGTPDGRARDGGTRDGGTRDGGAGDSREGGGGGLVPVALVAAGALIFALREDPFLHLMAGTLACAALAAALLRQPMRSGLAAWAGASAVGAASAAVLGVGALADARGLGRGRARRQALIVLRGSLAATPVLLVFGGLFVSADPLFEWYVRRALELGLETALEHTALALALAWVAAGILYGTRAVAVADPALPSEALGRWRAELIVALLLLDLLFLAFLAVEAGSLFGGTALVDSTTGLTYADYARRGFFQLIAVAALAIPALLALEWAVPPGSIERPRLVILSAALVAFVLVILASAWHRMALYQSAYGWTALRLYTTAFMVWLGLVCVWLAATALRGRRERFVAGALLGGAGVAAALAVWNPGGWTVRVNAARAAENAVPFDVVYATSLGADAVPALLDVVPGLDGTDRCRVAERLLRRWASSPEPDFRSWNLARWQARRSVAAREEDLLTILRACTAPPPTTRSR